MTGFALLRANVRLCHHLQPSRAAWKAYSAVQQGQVAHAYFPLLQVVCSEFLTLVTCGACLCSANAWPSRRCVRGLSTGKTSQISALRVAPHPLSASLRQSRCRQQSQGVRWCYRRAWGLHWGPSKGTSAQHPKVRHFHLGVQAIIQESIWVWFRPVLSKVNSNIGFRCWKRNGWYLCFGICLAIGKSLVVY